MTMTLEIARSAPSAAELGPVRPSERIAEIDILRGFALLGILVINLFYFDSPLSLRGSGAVELYPGRLDKAVRWIADFFIAGEVQRGCSHSSSASASRSRWTGPRPGGRRSPGCT